MKQRRHSHRSRNPRRAGAPRRDPLLGASGEVEIREIGARGDGIAVLTLPDGKSVLAYVDGVLPGDRVRVALRQRRGDGYGAEVLEILSQVPGRADAKCPHFEKCGGCALQHLPDNDYRNWKRARAVQAVMRAGVGDTVRAEELVGDVAISPPGSRRRAGFSVFVGADGVRVGFAERFSHHIVNVDQCAVLVPEIVVFRAAFQAFLEKVDKKDAAKIKEAFVNLTDTGLDVVLMASDDPGLDLRQDMAALAEDNNLARLSWKTGDNPSEPVAQRHTPQVHFAGVPVTVPAGGFLQATAPGEAAIVKEIGHALETISARFVIDLFCGIGSLTFPIALAGKRRRVLAVEGDVAAIRSLQYAAGQSNAPIEVQQRDLFRQPLDAEALTGADVVVFDPPRAGALAQCEVLAESGPEWILAVSCNPATFSRDIRVLRGGGYELQKVVPVDQFLWSPHLELFAVLRRTA